MPVGFIEATTWATTLEMVECYQAGVALIKIVLGSNAERIF